MCLGAIISSQLIHAWADTSYYVPVTSVSVQLPVYKGITATRQLARLGLVDPDASCERLLARRVASQLDDSANRVLNYPLSPLRCSNARPLNLLLIMADAMRSDMLQEATTPFLWKMANDEAQWFTQHFSGGNSSRMGVFSLFYDASSLGVYPEELNGVASLAPAGDDDVSGRRSDYKKSIRFLDGLIGEVLDDLEQQGVADRTVVIITSDHGQEFDESGARLMEHGSGYTTYQLKVPFLVRWPGRPAQRFDHRTSHYDVLLTLMTELLGCKNPVTDYASGVNLFEQRDWQWLVAGSYYNYAILEPDQVTIAYPGANFELRRWDYGIIPDPKVRGAVLEAVSAENTRFYRQ
jgi:membrane-anchored protein YejM (alkaline phosphatase superfamily)